MATRKDRKSVADERARFQQPARASVPRARAPRNPNEVPRWRRRKDARPGELLDAALEVFVERGYTATRLDDVARRAGVTKGAMYLYFENKEALFKAMVRDRIVGKIEMSEQLLHEHQGTARELLMILLERWWERIVEGPTSGMCKLVMSEVGSFPDLARFYHDEVINRSMKVFEHALRLGMARGEFRRIDPAMTVRIAIAPMLVAALWKHTFGRCVEGEQFEPRRFFDTHVEIFLAGLSAPNVPARTA